MSPETILVVDDSPLIANHLAQRSLPAMGYQTRVAHDGKTALQILKTKPIDLILLDYQLADNLTGLDLLNELKKAGIQVPTILMTAHGSEQIAVEAFRLGVQDYLYKPIDDEMLNEAINRALMSARLSQEKAALTALLQEQVQRLNALSEVGQSITSTLDVDQVLTRIVEAGVLLTQADEGFLALLDEPSGQLMLRVIKNMDEAKVRTMRLAVEDSLAGQVVRTKTSLRLHQSTDQQTLKVSTGFLVNSLIHVPILSKGKPLGVLSVDNHLNRRVFTEKDEDLLANLADFAAIALENAQLYQQAQQELAERKLIEQQLIHDAFYDSLTGLPNRALFLDRLKHAIERTKRHPDSLYAVLFIDLDRFKDINDSVGHLAGDEVLKVVARRLEASLRSADTLARLGGDEFVILLEELNDENSAIRVANWVQEELKNATTPSGHEILITASIGIALSVTGYQNPEDVLRDADIAMYSAKARGKARYEIFDPTMRARILQRLKLEAELRQAIERREFRVFFQPIVALESGLIVGVEALLRWQHPERGLLFPDEFISVLEETGLIVPVGEYVLRTACSQAKTWHLSGYPHMRVAVNISARQVHDQHLPLLVKTVLEDTGLDPGALEIEMTERMAMQDVNMTARMLKTLGDSGVKTSMDDFGSSYSSLDSLRCLPVNTLKIGQSFVGNLTQHSQDAAITKAIIYLAHSLGLNVIAEGVETMQQLSFLKANKCDQIQGFLVSRAIPGEALKKLL